MKKLSVFAFALALVSALGCSAQVTDYENIGTAGAAGGHTTPTPTIPISTGTLPPVHEAGQVIVSDENPGAIVADPALVGSQNVVVLQFAIEAVGNDADAANHEFFLDATTDGGSVVSLNGYPFFDGWKILDMNTGGLVLDGGVMQVMSSEQLRVRFVDQISTPDGTTRFLGLAANVAQMPSQPDQDQFLDHEYRATKTPYVEGDILDQHQLVIPTTEITEDTPMFGDPLVVTAGT